LYLTNYLYKNCRFLLMIILVELLPKRLKTFIGVLLILSLVTYG
jgi:hypothetical protein